jgi:hypothetical protein
VASSNSDDKSIITSSIAAFCLRSSSTPLNWAPISSSRVSSTPILVDSSDVCFFIIVNKDDVLSCKDEAAVEAAAEAAGEDEEELIAALGYALARMQK